MALLLISAFRVLNCMSDCICIDIYCRCALSDPHPSDPMCSVHDMDWRPLTTSNRTYKLAGRSSLLNVWHSSHQTFCVLL